MSTTNRSSRIGFLTAIGGLALVLAACSSSGGEHGAECRRTERRRTERRRTVGRGRGR